MANSHHEAGIFLSHHHMNNGFIFLHTTKYYILYWKNMIKGFQENSEFAEMRHGDVILTL